MKLEESPIRNPFYKEVKMKRRTWIDEWWKRNAWRYQRGGISKYDLKRFIEQVCRRVNKLSTISSIQFRSEVLKILKGESK